MFHRILLGTDGSDQAFAAADLTAELACRLGAQVVLVHALDPIVAAEPSAFVPDAILSADVAFQYAQEAQHATLRRTAHVFQKARVPCQQRAECGHPVDCILRVAEESHSDLIVMGSRGLSYWSALFLGSVSEGVVRHAPCPTLVVRGAPRKLQSIVIGSDGSRAADRALRTGVALAKETGAEVSVLNVFDPAAFYPGAPRNDEDLLSRAILAQEATELQAAVVVEGTGVQCRVYQEQGHPAETMVGFAEMQKADLIVVGSRGMGGFQRLLLGSTSAGVLHHARCSVLVVR